MAISTESIIHYTNTYAKLISIIEEGFKIKYCAEVLHTKEGINSTAHPMISFCDIPLSDSSRHFGLYGNYGIGLSKNWAKANGINPVLYIEKESNIGISIRKSFKAYPSISGENSEVIKEMIIETKCFTKNYSGPLKRGDIDTDNYKFYDEREWRFIPKKADIDNRPKSVGTNKYEADKKKYNDPVSQFRLTFSTYDISYIIVKETAEIPDIIQFLKTIFYKSTLGSDLDILLSKVCSTEQIIQDY